MSLVIGLSLSLSTAGCTEEKPVSKQLPELTFNIDASLLGQLISNDALSIAFSPPVDWERIPGDLINKIQEGINQAKVDNIEVIYGFKDRTTGSLFTVAKINPVKDFNPEKALEEYKTTLKASDDKANVRLGSFLHNNFTVHQLVQSTSSNVAFKLLISKQQLPHIIQIDFIFPKEGYTKFIKTTESVIGSIQAIGGASKIHKEGG